MAMALTCRVARGTRRVVVEEGLAGPAQGLGRLRKGQSHQGLGKRKSGVRDNCDLVSSSPIPGSGWQKSSTPLLLPHCQIKSQVGSGNADIVR